MFEYHGWMVLRSPLGDSETETEKAVQLMNEARTWAAEFTSGNPVVEVLAINGAIHVMVTGFHNRRLRSFDDVLAMYERAAERAPDSYGLLYARDDENPEGWVNKFRIWALARGALSERDDTCLSPCAPGIEEPND